MNVIVESSCGEAWISYLQYVLDQGVEQQDDDGLLIEAPPVVLQILDFYEPDPILVSHAHTDLLARYRDKVFKREVIFPFKYSYGDRLFNQSGVDQVEWMMDLLRTRTTSKSAAVSLLRPGEQFREVPCLTGLMAKIRTHQLLLTSIFRSQNAYTSYLNFLPLREVQLIMANGLAVEPGAFTVFVNTPHIYYKDTSSVVGIVNKETGRL
jgi:thymidylate synthase